MMSYLRKNLILRLRGMKKLDIINPIWTRGGQNCPTFSKFIIATNRQTAVKCGFVTFNEI